MQFVEQFPLTKRTIKGRKPGPGRPRSVFVGVADKLRANPQQWAIIKRYPKDKRDLARQHAHYIRAGKRYGFEYGTFEAEVVPKDDEVELYARFIG